MEQLSIGEVARRTGLRPSALRYYEDVGILPPPRRVNGRRRYDSDVLTQVAVVRMAQEAGFTIEEVRTLLTGFPEGTSASARWRALAHRKLVEVDALIARAQAMRRVLEESLECGCLTLEACAALGWGHRGAMGEAASAGDDPAYRPESGATVGLYSRNSPQGRKPSRA
jgi:MerR family transcriptional regulator, redox-sensitive transcriptional activator SoxR